MPRKHSFDSKCLDLARYFYPHASEPALCDLAQQLQVVVEDANLDAPVPETTWCPLGPTTHSEMIKRAEGCPGCGTETRESRRGKAGTHTEENPCPHALALQ